MRTRTKARQRAIEALFEADQRKVDVAEIFSRNENTNEYAVDIAKIAQSNIDRIDEVINTYSKDWPTGRMPAVDLAIVRIAVAELIFKKEIDQAIIISEAVEISKNLSTDESSKFINGLLSNIGNLRQSLTFF